MHLPFHLLPGSSDDSRMIVTYAHDAERGHEIHVTFSVKTVQVNAFSSDHGQIWPILGETWCEHLMSALDKFRIWDKEQWNRVFGEAEQGIIECPEDLNELGI